MVRLNGEQYWLDAAVGPGSNKFPHTQPEPSIIAEIIIPLFAELIEKHGVVNGDKTLIYAY